tara:strand:+ start:1263 stop:1862 length:600 start_codon:yes stop_codon:yes gene_type:complete
MKNKNILWLGAIGLGLYYLLKKDNEVSSQNSPTEGGNPSLEETPQSQPFTVKDLKRTDRTIVLRANGGLLRLEYKLPYRGGARPSRFMESTSGKWIVKGNLPNLTTTKVCKNSQIDGLDIMPVGIPFDDERNCVMVAQTKDVVQWIFSNDVKWSAEFGKKSWVDNFKPLPMKVRAKRKGMPTPTNRDLMTYGVPSGISL